MQLFKLDEHALTSSRARERKERERGIFLALASGARALSIAQKGFSIIVFLRDNY